jgi:hypothetical protein
MEGEAGVRIPEPEGSEASRLEGCRFELNPTDLALFFSVRLWPQIFLNRRLRERPNTSFVSWSGKWNNQTGHLAKHGPG